MTEITPQEIAVKFNPPKIAIVYKRNKNSYIREFLLDPSDLQENTTALIEMIINTYPGYFGRIDPNQIARLLNMIKSNQTKVNQLRFGKMEGFKPKGKEDLQHYNKFIDDMDLYSPKNAEEEEEGDEDLEEGYYEGNRKYNYDELDRNIENTSSDEEELF